jgi:myo-inositol-1(or 4)-monophosphatase
MQPIDVAIEAAQQAGALIRDRFHHSGEIHWKGPADMVTQVDQDAEEIIVRTIRQAFPDHEFLGEEGHKASPNAEHVWVIDPLDGTWNYATGTPFFSTSIALAVRGQPVLGVIYDALHDETFAAQAGQGVFVNGQRAHCSQRTHLEHASAALGIAPARTRGNPELALPILVRLHPLIEMARISGSAALALAYVACGRLDIAFFDCLHAWDFLAGVLMTTEGRGVVTELSGQPISLGSRDVLAACNPAFHAQVLQIAQQVRAEQSAQKP